MNLNTGRILVSHSEPLQPVNVVLEDADGCAKFTANEFEVSFQCESRGQLQDVLEAYHYFLPIVLNVDFIDAPVIEKVEGIAGGIPFGWCINKPHELSCDVTTTEIQEQKLASGLRRIELLAGHGPSGRRRLIAALHWFHVACRLWVVGQAPWEFLGEILLNYAKVLEVLFPSAEGRSMEQSRAGLRNLGFSEDEIEAWYVPALALRNHVDVAHVSLAAFEEADLTTLHEYAEEAEPHFRLLLSRVFDAVVAGTWELAEYEGGKPSDSALKSIERLRTAMQKQRETKLLTGDPQSHCLRVKGSTG
jgi:hypothetical protein